MGHDLPEEYSCVRGFLVDLSEEYSQILLTRSPSWKDHGPLLVHFWGSTFGGVTSKNKRAFNRLMMAKVPAARMGFSRALMANFAP